jgi:hypothetical protein
LFRKRSDDIVRARYQSLPRRHESLCDDDSIVPSKRRSHQCRRSLRTRRAAACIARHAGHTHVHVLAAAMRRLLRRKHARPNRDQQHAHKGESDRCPLAESTQHAIKISQKYNWAVTCITRADLQACAKIEDYRQVERILHIRFLGNSIISTSASGKMPLSSRKDFATRTKAMHWLSIAS